jgi:Na+/melibiose symporter-like transporter
MLTLVWLVWLALLPEITENNEERTKIALLIQAMVIIGAFPVLLAFYIYESGLLFFQIFSGICALISAVCYYTVGTKLKERPELYIQQEMPPLKRALKEVLGSRSFVTDTIFRGFNHMTFSLGIGFLFAYVFILGFDILTTALLFYLNYTFVTFVGFVIYKKLSMRHDMRTLVIRGRFIQLSLNVIGFFIVLQQGLELLIWVFLVINNIFNGYLLFDYPLLMLVTDDDEVIHGLRREGLIMGMNAFFIKIAQSLGPILGTFVLLYFGFIQNSPTQTSQALIGVKFLMFIVISILSLIGLISIYFFPLYGENLKKLNVKLLEIHNQKTQSYKG